MRANIAEGASEGIVTYTGPRRTTPATGRRFERPWSETVGVPQARRRVPQMWGHNPDAEARDAGAIDVLVSGMPADGGLKNCISGAVKCSEFRRLGLVQAEEFLKRIAVVVTGKLLSERLRVRAHVRTGGLRGGAIEERGGGGCPKGRSYPR